MTKKNIMPVVVLTVICVVVAALLAGVNMLTKGKIEQNALLKEQASLMEVMPSEVGFNELTVLDSMPDTVSKIYSEKSGKGYVVVVITRTQYSKGDMKATIAVVDGKVSAIKLTDYYDSKDFGKDYPNKFIGKDADTVMDVEAVSGVTYSSEAFRAAVADALEAVREVEALIALAGPFGSLKYEKFDGLAPAVVLSSSTRTDTELSALASELVGGKAVVEVALPEGAPATLQHLYSVDGGYVLYTVVAGDYVPVATEALVYVNSNGVIENVNLLSWIVGHGVGPDDFASRFVGKDIVSLDEVELVSGATGTSEDFYNEIDLALEAVTKLLGKRDERISYWANELLPGDDAAVSAEIPASAPATLKALYTNASGGLVAYVVVPGAYVPVATEALVYIDSEGVIGDVMLISWIVGHGVGAGDFATRFDGLDVWTDGNVELVAGATGTSKDFYDSFTKILDAVTDVLGVKEDRFNYWVNELLPGDDAAVSAEIPASAPATLKALYTNASGGYVAYVIVPGAYTPVATEALIYIDSEGVIGDVMLISWVVGHGVGPGDFENRFDGVDVWTDEVELVSGATGTSLDFYNTAIDTLKCITELLDAKEDRFIYWVNELASGKVTELELPADAPEALKRMFSDELGGYVLYVVVKGAYVPVATEAIIYVDRGGVIKDVMLTEWIVGHGIGPGDFASRFVGVSIKDAASVELVSGATGTSADFANALADVSAAIPERPVTYNVIATVMLVLLLVAVVAYTVISKTRRAAK